MKALKWIAGIAAGVFVFAAALGVILTAKYAGSGIQAVKEALREQGWGEESVRGDLDASLSGVSRIYLDIEAADIIISRGDQEAVFIQYQVEGWKEGEDVVTASQDGDSLRIVSRIPDYWNTRWFFSSWLSRRCSIQVVLPREYAGDLRVATDAGVIRLPGAQTYRSLEIETDAATIHIDDVTAQSAELNVDAGTVTAERLSVPLVKASADAGTIRLQGLTGGAELSLGAGSADLRFEKLAGDVKAKVDMGRATLYLPENTGAELSLTADMGHVSQDFGAAFSGTDKSTEITGTLGAGGSRVTGSVSMGSLELVRQ